MVTETDLELSDGRRLRVYGALADGADNRSAVFWHHGTLTSAPAGAPVPGWFGVMGYSGGSVSALAWLCQHAGQG